MSKNFFLNLKKAKSKNCSVISIIGARGKGKTFAVKEECLLQFLRFKNEFARIRYLKSEIEVFKSTFLDDLKAKSTRIKKEELEKFFIKGFKLFYKDGNKNIRVGTFAYLSIISNSRGVSLPLANTLVFDEFLNEEGSEDNISPLTFKRFSSYVNTLFRLKGVNEARIYLLANAITTDNIFFKLFKFELPKDNEEFSINKALTLYDEETKANVSLRTCLWVVQDDSKFVQKSKISLAGMIAQLSDYGEFAISNKFYLDDKECIIAQNEIKASLNFKINLRINDTEIGYYECLQNNFVYFGKPQSTGKTYVFNNLKEATKENHFALSKKSTIVKGILKLYTQKLLAFDSIETKNRILYLLNKSLNS